MPSPSTAPAPLPPGRRRRRRWLIALGGVLVLLGALGGAAALLAPRLGPWMLERRVLPALEKRFGRKITVGRVRGGLRQAVLEDVRVSGPRDCAGAPLLAVGRVTLDYEFWPLLSGRLALRGVRVEQPRICVRRLADGTDNLRDLLEALRRRPLGKRVAWQLDAVTLSRGALDLRDEARGARLAAPDLEARLVPGGESRVVLRHPRLTWPGLEPLAARRLVTTFRTRLGRLVGLPDFAVSGARLRLHERLVLTDIAGRLTPEPGQWLGVDLEGSYGGVGEPLWKARGRVQLASWRRPRPVGGRLAVQAHRFSLDKLAPILKTSLVPNPGAANLEVDLTLGLEGRVFSFGGRATLSGLTVIHPLLAAEPVEGLGATGRIQGRYLIDQDLLQISEASLEREGVRLEASADVFRLRGKPRVKVTVAVPPVSCARVLRALPRGLVPKLQRMRVAGTLALRVTAEADFKYLTTSSVSLEGSVDARACQVVSMPWDLSAERLRGPFGHEVEEAGVRLGFEVGPENPDFVPLDQISPHLQNAILTTEDSRFYFHKGFIPSEFQIALARNLIARRFVFGASSITMQTVKNVLLGRRKTLSRKLQEVILTWYLERNLPKRRILEIYLNVIEFGPGIYGVGRAAQHLFGKTAAALEPQEAAYLASILPRPKTHYRKFCHQQVSPGWRRWVDRILGIMQKRGRLNASELELALVSPLRFSDQERGTLAECLARLDRFSPRR